MIVELDKISKYYEKPGTKNRREVLKEISLTINDNDSIAIIGPSGSGKSTLLNIIGTLDVPTSGVVRFNEKEVNSLQEKQLAAMRNQNIGFVFQLHHLLPQLNLIENVLVPVIPEKEKTKRKAAMARAMDLLDNVGLADKIHQRPGQFTRCWYQCCV